MARGDHIFVSREGYTHHGIDLGDGTVVHLAPRSPAPISLFALIAWKSQARVRRVALGEFASGRAVWIREYLGGFDPDTVVKRALSRCGDHGYHLADNNCEHFACWCKTGHHHSEQVRNVAAKVVSSAGVVSAVGAGLGVVSASGPIAGLGASGAAAGLSAVGLALGGGPAAGLIAVVAVPAVASVVAVRSVLVDDSACNAKEREARAAARVAGVGGVTAGTVAAISAVAAAGVPGVSAVGIATGLAALGAGSAAVGLAAVLGFPAVVTLGAGWLAYKLRGGGEFVKQLPAAARSPTALSECHCAPATSSINFRGAPMSST
jgi:hypothetical protein